MAYRGGRGRGRGGFGRGASGYAKPVQFVPFPDVELSDIKSITVEPDLVTRSFKLQRFWVASSYYYEETVSKKSQSVDIERFSDRNKPKTTFSRDSLSQILELKKFPQELTLGSKQQHRRKRIRWNPNSDLSQLDKLEKLESVKGNEEGEDEEAEEDNEDEFDEEEEAEALDEDDYNQNVDFDDDEDDYNDDDGGNDEPFYD